MCKPALRTYYSILSNDCWDQPEPEAFYVKVKRACSFTSMHSKCHGMVLGHRVIIFREYFITHILHGPINQHITDHGYIAIYVMLHIITF
jgi:hypothetical protein